VTSISPPWACAIAWEIAAQTHVKVNEPERIYTEAAATAATQRTSVTIDDKDLCPRYVGGIIERVKVGPSPEWMQRRLRLVGVRAISNIVDITNYVMMEWGQPLHAFDYDKLVSRAAATSRPGSPRALHVVQRLTRSGSPKARLRRWSRPR